MSGAQKPVLMSQALQRVAEKARREPMTQFTSLAHLVTVEALEEAFRALKKRASPGFDGVTVEEYGRDLRSNLERLHERLRTGRYIAPPVKRTYVPKEGGKRRPIGIPTIEDKVVQSAVARVLSAIYEQLFLDFSYGFRPGRNPHQALDALEEALFRGEVNYVLDVDLRTFFDSMDHGVLRAFVERRVKDRSLLRLIAKWLKAGVLEDGGITHPNTGTPQGGVISPLLANVYLHYVLDVWADKVARQHMRGQFHVVRYADDVVFGFEYRDDAERFAKALRGRLAKYKLALNEDKTRLIEFGRRALVQAERRGQKPDTFDFLGFTHISARSRKGKITVLRQTAAKRLRGAIGRVSAWCQRNRHRPVPDQRLRLSSVLRGHYQYYGLTGNIRSLKRFHRRVLHLWRKWLDRRSQRGRMSWERFAELLQSLPLPAPWLPHSVYRHV
jgi:RNA-directed DNA polymerase